MFSRVLILLGLIFTAGSLSVAYWLASLACAMNTADCQEKGWDLFIDLMRSEAGLAFWLVFSLGLILLFWGFWRLADSKPARFWPRSLPPGH